MIHIAGLLLAMSPPQQPPTHSGWNCQVEQDLGSGVRMIISQNALHPGDESHALIVQVELQPDRFERASQLFQWAVTEPSKHLPAPQLLSLEVDLKSRDRKASVRIDYAEGGQSSPAHSTVERPVRHKAWVHIRDRVSLDELWANTGWTVSILDKRGNVQSSVEGALPSRADIVATFERLAPSLASKVLAPEGQCHELDATAWV